MYIYTWYEYDEFFSIPIHSTHQKYLKFTFDDFFQWKCMSTGYGPAMIVFTKISKVPFGHLRTLSHNFLVYEDDSYTKLVLIKFQTPLNYWWNWALLFTQTNEC